MSVPPPPDHTEPGPTEPGPTEPDPTEPDPTEPALRRWRTVDPARRDRADVAPAGSVLAVMLAALLLAAAINSSAMVTRVEAGPLGPQRDLALAFWRPLSTASGRIGLTGPRANLDALRARGSSNGGDGGSLVAGADQEEEELAGPTATLGSAPAPTLGSAPYVPPSVPVYQASPPAGPTLSSTQALDPTRSIGPAQPLGPTQPFGPTSPSDPTLAAGPIRPSFDLSFLSPGSSPVVGTTGLDPASSPLSSSGPAPAGPVAPLSSSTTSPMAPASPAAANPAAPTAPMAPASPRTLRRATADQPLRVLVAGDSTMDALGASILRELAPTGVTKASLQFRVSSGLARPDFYDWPAQLRLLADQTHYELLVIMLGANDAQPFLIDGRAESFGTDLWLTTYRARMSALMSELTARGTAVVWVGLPIMRNNDFEHAMGQLNQIYAEEVRRIPGGVFVDSRPTLSDRDGAYAAYLPDASGNRQRVRLDDGVHFSGAGADRLALVVVDAINTLAPLH